MNLWKDIFVSQPLLPEVGQTHIIKNPSFQELHGGKLLLTKVGKVGKVVF
ncbi:hypothetical protein [Aerosakkonema funiforme]